MNRGVLRLTVFCTTLLFLIGAVPAQEPEHGHQHDPEQQEERDRDRWMWQLPETVIRTIGVEEGMVVADVGAGYGYFTLRLARAVGREGHVYANDIDHDALAQLENRCANDGVNNVTTILGESSDPLLPPGVDLVLMVNTIHLLEDPVAFLQRISDSLQPQARLVIVQWDAEKMSAELGDLSPGDKILFARETFLATVGDAGFTLDRIETFLPVQSIFIYRRNS